MTVRSPISRALPLAAETEPAKARLIRVGGAVLALFWTAYVLHVLTGSSWGDAFEAFFNSWVFSAMVLGAACMCLARGLLVENDQLAWTVLGGGMLSWGAASVYWSLFLKHMEAPRSSCPRWWRTPEAAPLLLSRTSPIRSATCS